MSEGPPEGVLTMRAAALIPQEDGTVKVTLIKDGGVFAEHTFASRDLAQACVDDWTAEA